MGISIKSNAIIILATLVSMSACIPGVKGGKTNINVSSQVSKISVEKIEYKNNQIVIKGTNLSMVKKVSINGNSTNHDLSIVSETANEIVVEAASALKLTANVVYDLILADAWGQTSFPLTFDLSDNTVSTTKIVNGAVTLPKITTTGANKGDTIRYNGTNWEFASISQSQVYMGTFDAQNTTVTSNGVVSVIANVTPSAGDYYIVTVAGLYNNIQYNVGDWIISDGLSWQNIPAKNTTVVSFQGRQGVVTLDPTDYTSLLNASKKLPGSNLKNIEDVDVVTTAPANGFVLGYNGTSKTWGPIDLSNLFQGKQDANNYVTALTGDVTASGPTGGGSAAATVAKVGGQTAAAIATAVIDVQNATNNNTVSTIVKRAANGAVAVGPLTATTITTSNNITVTGSVTATTLSGTLPGSNVSGNITGNAANVTGTVAVVNGGTGATTLPTNALLFGNGTSAIGSLAAPTTAKVLLTNNAGVLGWQSSSTPGAILKSDSVNGAYFGTLTASDLPSGTMTGTGSTNYIPYYTSSSTMGSSPVYIAPSTSYVGINTTSPSSVLEVAGNPTFSGPNNVGSYLKFTDGNGINNYIGFDRAITPASTTTDLVMQSSSTSQSIKFKIGNTEKARIDGATGNVGIGIAVPLYPLHVKTTAGSVATLESTSAAAMLGFIDSATTTRPQIGSSGNGLNFQTNGSGRMLIDSTGNVGIGMSAAAANKLDVNGQTNTTTLCIAGDCKSAWNMLSSNIQDGTIVNADINASAAIDATKINTGVVSNAEFNYLDGVTSAIQTQLDGKQPLDSTLTALAAYNSNGIMVQTAADTFTARTITGTANRLVVTNGSGVGGNPTLDVDTSLFPSPVAGDAGKYLKSSGANSSAWSTITGSDLTYTGGTFPFATASSVTVPAPVNLNDAVTKSYVDSYGQWTKSSSDVYRSTGNVGIGTTSMNSTLHVKGTFQVNDASDYVKLRVNSNYVEVGLNLNSADAGTGILRITGSENSNVGTFETSRLEFSNNSNRVGQSANSVAQISSYQNADAGTNNGDLRFLTKDGTSLLERMLIDRNGNVGVGTSSPASPLHVDAAASAGKEIARFSVNGTGGTNSTSNYSYVSIVPGSTNYHTSLRLHTNNAGTYQEIRNNSGALELGTNDANPIQIFTNALTRIFISNTGNVGIGTISPSQKLSVAGTIESTSGGFKFPDGTTQTTAASGASSQGAVVIEFNGYSYAAPSTTNTYSGFIVISGSNMFGNSTIKGYITNPGTAPNSYILFAPTSGTYLVEVDFAFKPTNSGVLQMGFGPSTGFAPNWAPKLNVTSGVTTFYKNSIVLTSGSSYYFMTGPNHTAGGNFEAGSTIKIQQLE